MMHRAIASVTLLAAAATALCHFYYWQGSEFVDGTLWENRIIQLTTDISSGHLNPLNEVYSGHPGMSIATLGTVIANIVPVEPRIALVAAVSLLTGISSGSIIYVLQRHGFSPLWLLCAWTIFTFHPLYLPSTPTNIVVATLACACILVANGLLAGILPNRYHFILLGFLSGLALVTRMPATAILALPLLVLLFARMPRTQLLLSGLVGFLTILLFDPLLWQRPLAHLEYIFFRSHLNYTDYVPVSNLTIETIITLAPLSIVSIGIAIYCAFTTVRAFILKQALSAILASTLLYGIIFFSVNAPTLRHFLPLVLLWELLLPFLAAPLLYRVITKYTQPKLRLIQQAPILVAVLIAISELALFIYNSN